MKNDDIELLREVQRNAEMGMHALEVINPKVYDDSMALMLARESFKYGELHDRARAVLLSKNQTPDPVNKVKQLMLTASIQGNTLLNSTTSHMAEMLIRGSSMGMTSLWYFNFTGCIVETALKSLRLSCGSELTRQGISLP